MRQQTQALIVSTGGVYVGANVDGGRAALIQRNLANTGAISREETVTAATEAGHTGSADVSTTIRLVTALVDVDEGSADASLDTSDTSLITNWVHVHDDSICSKPVMHVFWTNVQRPSIPKDVCCH